MNAPDLATDPGFTSAIQADLRMPGGADVAVLRIVSELEQSGHAPAGSTHEATVALRDRNKPRVVLTLSPDGPVAVRRFDRRRFW